MSHPLKSIQPKPDLCHKNKQEVSSPYIQARTLSQKPVKSLITSNPSIQDRTLHQRKKEEEKERKSNHLRSIHPYSSAQNKQTPNDVEPLQPSLNSSPDTHSFIYTSATTVHHHRSPAYLFELAVVGSFLW